MKRFVFLLLTLIILGGAFWWQRQLPDRDVREVVVPVPPSPATPQVIAEDVELNIRSQGKLLWQLTIEKVRVPTDGSTAWVTGLKRGIYFREGKPYLTVTAGQLQYNPTTENILVSGDIHLRSEDGLSLSTSQMRWDKEARRIVCPGAVRMQVKETTITTQKVFLYPDEKKLVCPQAVNVTSPNAQLRSDKLAANLQTEQFEMSGNVSGTFRIRRTTTPKEGV